MVNTTEFKDKSDEEYKTQIQTNWSKAPCGANYSSGDALTPEFFRETAEFRYRSHPWILEEICALSLQGKRMLEIGYGIGIDHLSLADAGAELVGVDLTARHTEITRARFDHREHVSRLTIGDGENLPFANDDFDAVYSFGAIHHSPNTDKIVAEIHRILKPGGRCHITVYHKYSVFFGWSVYLVNYLLRGGYRRRSLQQQLSLIEYPNDNPDIVVRLYSRKQIQRVFSAFADTRVHARHLLPVDIEYLASFYRDPFRPRRWMDWIGRWFGWYLIVDATK